MGYPRQKDIDSSNSLGTHSIESLQCKNGFKVINNYTINIIYDSCIETWCYRNNGLYGLMERKSILPNK